ncbi:MAG: hypothetical protein WCD81_03015 [Candidatus Bathyarchaeia archaeon]
MEGGELEDKKGSRQLSVFRSNWLPILLAIMVTLTIFFIIPIFKETDIHIQIGYSDDIQNVWVDTPSKSLISPLFGPSYSLGAYVLNISITLVSQSIANFSRINVPIGEYVIVWQSNVPDHGLYTIKVELYKLQVLKSTYSINISF